MRQSGAAGLARQTSGLNVRAIQAAERKYQDFAAELDTARNSVKVLHEAYEQKQVKKAVVTAALLRVQELETYLPAMVAARPMPLRELRTQDERGLLIDIKTLLIDLLKYFGTVQETVSDRISEVAEMIAFELGDLTLEDLVIVFKRAKAGEVEIYNRLDGAVVMKWLKAHRKQKQEALAEYNQRLHASHKGEVIGRTVSDIVEAQKLYQRQMETYKENQAKVTPEQKAAYEANQKKMAKENSWKPK